MPVPSHVLSLRDAASRRASICTQMEAIGLEFSFFDAIDGRGQDRALARFYDVYGNARDFKRPLGTAEVACALGHRKLWQIAVQSENDFTLVLEDDALFDDGLKAFLVAAQQSGGFLADVMVKLDTTQGAGGELGQLGGVGLVAPSKLPAGTAGYLLGKRAAAKLLASMPERISRPVDMDLKHYWEHGILILTTTQAFVHVPPDKGGSLLEVDRERAKSASKIARFVRNMRYQFNMSRQRKKHPVEGMHQALLHNIQEQLAVSK